MNMQTNTLQHCESESSKSMNAETLCRNANKTHKSSSFNPKIKQLPAPISTRQQEQNFSKQLHAVIRRRWGELQNVVAPCYGRLKWNWIQEKSGLSLRNPRNGFVLSLGQKKRFKGESWRWKKRRFLVFGGLSLGPFGAKLNCFERNTEFGCPV